MGKRINAYAIHSVVCEEIGIGERSPADVAIVKSSHRIQKPENILLIVEVKMSIPYNVGICKIFPLQNIGNS